jgi:hypothetical protein
MLQSFGKKKYCPLLHGDFIDSDVAFKNNFSASFDRLSHPNNGGSNFHETSGCLTATLYRHLKQGQLLFSNLRKTLTTQRFILNESRLINLLFDTDVFFRRVLKAVVKSEI